jgi:hypothetical protein
MKNESRQEKPMKHLVDVSRFKTFDTRSILTLTTIIYFVWTFLITHEVSLLDSLTLILVLTLDFATGAMLWILASKKESYSVLEIFGVGVALGTSLNTIGQMLLVGSQLQEFFNLVLFIIVLLVFITKPKVGAQSFKLTSISNPSLLGIFASSLLLLSGDRYYLWIGVIAFYLFALVSAKLPYFKTFNSQRNILTTALSLGLTTIAMIAASMFETQSFGKRSTVNYISGWDGTIFEASSKALVKYGPFDNIFLSNIKYAYYWFQDSWAGSITQRAHTSDWVVTTQFGLILTALTTTSLLFVVISRRTDNLMKVLLVLVIATTASLIGAPSVLLSLASFSQVVAVLWLAWAIFLIDEIFRFKRNIAFMLLTFVCCLLVMTKITLAVPVIVGVFAAAIFGLLFTLENRIYFKLLISSLSTATISAALYFIFIKPSAELSQSYFGFQIGITDNMFGIVTGIVAIDLVAFALIRFTPATILMKPKEILSDSFDLTLLLISIASITVALALKFELSVANTYMLIPFLLCFSLVVGLKLVNNFDTEVKRSVSTVFFAATAVIFGLLGGFVSSYRLHNLNYQFVTASKELVPATALSLIFVFAATFVFFVLHKIRRYSLSPLIFLSIALVSVSVGSFVSHSLRGVQKDYIYTKNAWEIDKGEDVASKFDMLTSVVAFTNKNLFPNDVIASNSTTEKGLLAAMTGIRNFASSYTSDMQGVENRYPAQANFAISPSQETYNVLRQECVTWYYFDLEEINTQIPSFKEFAQVRFKDEFGFLLELDEKTELPTNCLK